MLPSSEGCCGCCAGSFGTTLGFSPPEKNGPFVVCVASCMMPRRSRRLYMYHTNVAKPATIRKETRAIKILAYSGRMLELVSEAFDGAFAEPLLVPFAL